MPNKTPLDTATNMIASCDWITPTWTILKDAVSGPVTRFGVWTNAGFDRGTIRRLLSKNGVESWGYIYNVAGDLIMFSVPEAQAQAAYQALGREGVPVLGGPADQELAEEARPSVAMGNTFHTGKMTIVPTPSILDAMGRLLKRLAR